MFLLSFQDQRLVPGAGAVEMALSKKINTYGTQFTGLEQYAIQKYAVALQSVARMLAENSGFKARWVTFELGGLVPYLAWSLLLPPSRTLLSFLGVPQHLIYQVPSNLHIKPVYTLSLCYNGWTHHIFKETQRNCERD